MTDIQVFAITALELQCVFHIPLIFNLQPRRVAVATHKILPTSDHRMTSFFKFPRDRWLLSPIHHCNLRCTQSQTRTGVHKSLMTFFSSFHQSEFRPATHIPEIDRTSMEPEGQELRL